MCIKNIKNNTNGVTLIALSITIVVMIILAGIGIYGSTDMIKKAKLEEMKTNMLLLEAKAREYVESATLKWGLIQMNKRNKMLGMQFMWRKLNYKKQQIPIYHLVLE